MGIYVSLPTNVAKKVRKTMLQDAAKLAQEAAEEPSNAELREEVTGIYYAVKDIDDKLEADAKREAEKDG